MLRDIHIRNFALIDDLSLSFGAGLNILTGETGAGKSIIIDALGFVLGDRVNASDAIRTGADRASVEAVFELRESHTAVWEKLRDLGLDDGDDSMLMMARELSGSSGKSQCRVNGRLVPVAVLKDVGDSLVDVHGQHEHQSLLSADRHVDILDEWCGKTVLTLRAELATAVARLGKINRDLEQLRADARERARMIDLYRFQVDEITAADLKSGEEELLAAERTRLANASKLATASTEAYDYLTGAERARGALDLLNAAMVSVDHAVSMDENLQPIVEALRESISFAEDAARDLRRYQDAIEFNPERLEEIDNRLETFKQLKRKYGETLEEILTYLTEIGEKLSRLENSEAREAELLAAVDKAEREVQGFASRLTELRQAASSDFALKITRELADLGMSATRFEVAFTPQPITAKGAEKIEFLISPNPGEPLKPLARIASGGEMSRVMLAIKSVMAGTVGMPTMIFDEIDVGVGGRTANVLGDKLAALASSAQILCITHLPQIAARAGTHFLIEKSVSGGRTVVSVKPLSTEQRVDEIVRMLGGTTPSEAIVQHAREMLTVSR
jgi:DNA repair protein RecN (Recombination protein N)